MARLSPLLLLTIAVIAVKAQEDCVCQEYTEEDKQQIWAFLTRLSGELPPEDGVLPGILSPLIPCGNCLDNSRKKRTIFPDPSEDVADINDEYDSSVEQKADVRCPVGYGRIAFRCINLADLYK